MPVAFVDGRFSSEHIGYSGVIWGVEGGRFPSLKVYRFPQGNILSCILALSFAHFFDNYVLQYLISVLQMFHYIKLQNNKSSYSSVAIILGMIFFPMFRIIDASQLSSIVDERNINGIQYMCTYISGSETAHWCTATSIRLYCKIQKMQSEIFSH